MIVADDVGAVDMNRRTRRYVVKVADCEKDVQ